MSSVEREGRLICSKRTLTTFSVSARSINLLCTSWSIIAPISRTTTFSSVPWSTSLSSVISFVASAIPASVGALTVLGRTAPNAARYTSFSSVAGTGSSSSSVGRGAEKAGTGAFNSKPGWSSSSSLASKKKSSCSSSSVSSLSSCCGSRFVGAAGAKSSEESNNSFSVFSFPKRSRVSSKLLPASLMLAPTKEASSSSSSKKKSSFSSISLRGDLANDSIDSSMENPCSSELSARAGATPLSSPSRLSGDSTSSVLLSVSEKKLSNLLSMSRSSSCSLSSGPRESSASAENSKFARATSRGSSSAKAGRGSSSLVVTFSSSPSSPKISLSKSLSS